MTVQGNMIGDEAYADYMGNVVAQRLLPGAAQYVR